MGDTSNLLNPEVDIKICLAPSFSYLARISHERSQRDVNGSASLV
jgi:hypothetical protein